MMREFFTVTRLSNFARAQSGYKNYFYFRFNTIKMNEVESKNTNLYMYIKAQTLGKNVQSREM